MDPALQGAAVPPHPLSPSFYLAIDLCLSEPGRVSQQLPSAGQRSLLPCVRPPGSVLIWLRWTASYPPPEWGGGAALQGVDSVVPSSLECESTLLRNCLWSLVWATREQTQRTVGE